MTSSKLDLLRQAFPIFRELPDNVVQQIDLEEFVIPPDELLENLYAVALSLDAHVVLYHSKYAAVNEDALTLCTFVVSAELSNEDLASLQSFERNLNMPGVAIVAYQKPVVLWSSVA